MRILFFMLIFLPFIGYGQLMQESNTSNAMRRVLTKNGFRLPQTCGFPATPNLLNYTGDSAAGALVYDTCNQLIGAWDGEKWMSLNVTKNGFLIIPQVTYAGFSLTYDVTPGAWLTNGVLYTSNDTTIVLAALADIDSSRTDVFVAESTGAGQINTITGTESANPLTPQPDPSYQLFITHVTLNPSNQTAGVDTVLIYDENVEWTGSATGVTVDFGGTTNPYRGTKTTDVSAINSGDIIKYTDGNTYNQTQYDGISFYIRLKTAMPSNNNIYVSFFNGASQVSNELAIPLNKTNVTTYQGISLAMASFSFTNSLFDAVRYRYTGSGISGLYLDFIYLQNGIIPIVVGGDYVKSVRRRSGTDTVEMLKDNGWEFAFIDSIGGGGSGITELTGDVTAGPGSGSQAATLATVNANVGTFKKATVTANGKGLITAIAEGMGVDTIYRKAGQDSIFYKINGGTERAVKDSTGSSTGLTSDSVYFRRIDYPNQGFVSKGAGNGGAGTSLGTALNPRNIAIGDSAMRSVTTGTNNLAIGYRALQNFTAPSSTGDNVAIGSFSLQNCTTCFDNFAFGGNALRDLVGGNENFAIGKNTMLKATSAGNNIAIGAQAMSNGIVTGSGNIGIGKSTLDAITSATNNIAIGSTTLQLITTSNNTFVGVASGTTGTTKSGGNVGIGNTVLAGAGSKEFNVACYRCSKRGW